MLKATIVTVAIALSPVLGLSQSCASSSTSSCTESSSLIGPDYVQTIAMGGVAVIPNWLPPDLVRRMRLDVGKLFEDGFFTPDGLTNTAVKKESQGFSKKADRQTFRGGDGWYDVNAGDFDSRKEFADRMKALRTELAAGLDRPTLVPEGVRKHEMTYNWYEPGAKLGRHLDEHHEETKGPKGWQLPTRRSVTWLVYLNDDWKEEEGGALHCFPRKDPSTVPVGAHEGNLQVGWIDDLHPVFLDAWRPSGQVALYRLTDIDDKKKSAQQRKEYVSAVDFDVPRQPIEFDQFLQPDLKNRFEQISTARLDPRFVSAEGRQQASIISNSDKDGLYSMDVVPAAGTLVVFDSVTLPHLVKEVTGNRHRIAATGWFHEDSQGLPLM